MNLLDILYSHLTKLGYKVEKTHCLLCYWYHPEFGCLESECDGVSHFYSDFLLLKQSCPNDPRLEVIMDEG